MTTSLENIKKRCLKHYINPALKERYKHSWGVQYALHVTHFFSIRIVYLLVKTSIRPNDVTYLGLLCGTLSAYVYAKESAVFQLLGMILFEIYYILDAVDGQLARAKNISSRQGIFLDEWGNFIIPPIVLYGIGLSQLDSLDGWALFLAPFSVLSISIIEILKEKVAYGRNNMDKIPPQETSTNTRQGIFRFIFSLLYRSCTMPVIMNLTSALTILNVLKIVLWDISPLTLLIYYYAGVGTIIWIVKGIHSGYQLNRYYG